MEMEMDETTFSTIEAVVASGRAVISADDSSVVASVQEAVRQGRSMTFYLPRVQADRVFSWFYTPKQIKESGVAIVPAEERERIQAELDVREFGELYSNRVPCPCGHVYGAFEFVQQGIREHGLAVVKRILEMTLKGVSVVRVNPLQISVCPSCERKLLRGYEYVWWPGGYGCCNPSQNPL